MERGNRFALKIKNQHSHVWKPKFVSQAKCISRRATTGGRRDKENRPLRSKSASSAARGISHFEQMSKQRWFFFQQSEILGASSSGPVAACMELLTEATPGCPPPQRRPPCPSLRTSRQRRSMAGRGRRRAKWARPARNSLGSDVFFALN